jgi:hypothetical protein
MNKDGIELTLPLFRLMEEKGVIVMVPYDAEFLAQYGGKSRDECKHFAQNPNFVSIPEDDLGPGYHALDNQGDGFKVSGQGVLFLPRVYYVTHGGIVISCVRVYVKPEIAKEHLLAGTADILGRRVVGGKKKEYRYLIRTYTIMSCQAHKRNRRRSFEGSDCLMDRQQAILDLGAIVLTTLVGPRPKGFVVQHDEECWNNAIDCIRWFSHRQNNLKENRDPQ